MHSKNINIEESHCAIFRKAWLCESCDFKDFIYYIYYIFILHICYTYLLYYVLYKSTLLLWYHTDIQQWYSNNGIILYMI